MLEKIWSRTILFDSKGVIEAAWMELDFITRVF